MWCKNNIHTFVWSNQIHISTKCLSEWNIRWVEACWYTKLYKIKWLQLTKTWQIPILLHIYAHINTYSTIHYFLSPALAWGSLALQRVCKAESISSVVSLDPFITSLSPSTAKDHNYVNWMHIYNIGDAHWGHSQNVMSTVGSDWSCFTSVITSQFIFVALTFSDPTMMRNSLREGKGHKICMRCDGMKCFLGLDSYAVQLT